MKIYLAGVPGYLNEIMAAHNYDVYRLNSYYHMAGWEREAISKYRSFMLDSGAFTFMSNPQNKDVDWNSYVDEYADFINEYGVDLFFELDIDNIVGIKRVEKLRNRLEKRTGKQSIPVWHRSRGLEYWKSMSKDYSYISIGGIVTKEIKPKEYSIFLTLLDIAHNKKCQVHGLGFTRQRDLPIYPFDSVDSTAWVFGNMGGFLYHFTGAALTKTDVPEGKRLVTRKALEHNFAQWVKYQQYADKNL